MITEKQEIKLRELIDDIIYYTILCSEKYEKEYLTKYCEIEKDLNDYITSLRIGANGL